MNAIPPGLYPQLSAAELGSKTINGSHGEYLCAKALSKATEQESWYVLRSYHVEEHLDKHEGEVDFLLITSTCIICIEVKGSSVRNSERGFEVWNRGSKSWEGLKESPFTQSQQNSYSLQEEIRNLGPNSFKMPIIWCVWFPEMSDFNPGLEFADWRIGTEDDLREPVAFFERLIERSKESFKKTGTVKFISQPSQILNKVVRTLRQLNNGQDEGVDWSLIKSRLNNNLKLLTESQYNSFRKIERNRKVLTYGGAGTGKTYLAMVEALRLLEKGQRIFFLVWSENVRKMLQLWFNNQNAALGNLKIVSFEKSNWEGITHNLNSVGFDALLVDEFQDFYQKDSFYELIESFEGKVVRLFGDHVNQVIGTLEENQMDRMFERLQDFSQLLLDENCRNTRNLIISVKNTTGLDKNSDYLENSIQGEAPVSLPGNSAEAILKVLKEKKEQGAEHSDLVIINLEASQLDYTNDLLANDEYPIERFDFSKEGIRLASVDQVKGLEFSHVVIIGVGRALNSTELRNLYIAMTRAVISCTLMYDLDERFSILPLINKFNAHA